MSSKVDRMVNRAVWLAGGGNLGYTQGSDRWNVWENGHGDCASYNITCAREAGIPVDGATYTGDMVPKLKSVGWKEIPLSKRHYGCFVVRPKTSTRGGHTAMVIDNNDNVAEALSNEFGGITGGKPGDQTGREVVVRKYNGFANTCLEPPADAYKDLDVKPPAPAPKPEPKKPEKEPDYMINGNEMFRLYNKNTGAHMFTTSSAERDSLVKQGWTNEGVAWKVDYDRTPVYRLYNTFTGDHMYTASLDECNNLIKSGWSYEGVADYASRNKQDGLPVYRLFNNKSGDHMFTTSRSERDALTKTGNWKSEGVAWYTTTK